MRFSEFVVVLFGARNSNSSIKLIYAVHLIYWPFVCGKMIFNATMEDNKNASLFFTFECATTILIIIIGNDKRFFFNLKVSASLPTQRDQYTWNPSRKWKKNNLSRSRRFSMVLSLCWCANFPLKSYCFCCCTRFRCAAGKFRNSLGNSRAHTAYMRNICMPENKMTFNCIKWIPWINDAL